MQNEIATPLTERSNVAGRLERLPVSRFHIVAGCLIGAAMFFDGYDLALTGLVIPSLVKTGLLPDAMRDMFISLPLFGAAIGSIAAGAIGDRWGRRRLFLCNVAIYGIASPLCGLVHNVEALLVLRVITMLALGTQIPTGYSYLSELAPRLSRARFQATIALLVNGALPVGALIAWLIVPHTDRDTGWRVMFWLSGIAVLVALAPPSILPESPRWLAAVGRHDRADRIIAGIEQRMLRRGVELAAPAPMPLPVQDLGWSALFARGIRARFALAVLFQICHLSAIFVLVSWLPTIMVARGFGVQRAFSASAMTFVGGALGPLVSIVIADRFERRWLMAFAAVLAAVMGLIYPLQSAELPLVAIGLVLTTTMYFMSATGYGIYIPEIMPTGVRLRGAGTATLVGRITAAVSPFAVSAIMARWNDPFIVVAGVGLLYLVLAPAFILLGPNTRGRSLESLEQSALRRDERGVSAPAAVSASDSASASKSAS
jgi:putative MFS transporter